MTDYVKAWRCIGCGMIEAPQTCIGVCEYRKTDLVYAFEHEQVLAQAAAAQQRANALEAVVRQLASTTPRKGEWERSYRALQEQARRVLPGLAAEAA
jgi:plasmid stabilization system protein ParE